MPLPAIFTPLDVQYTTVVEDESHLLVGWTFGSPTFPCRLSGC
jgi:hypothetical protein